MNEFDKALQDFLQDMDDQERQSRFFDLFLNTTFYIPTIEQKDDEEETGKAAPLVLSAEDRDFLMLFDSEKRLTEWAQQEAPCVAVPGHVLATNTPENLHWMLNYGCDPSKEFTPPEIAWLQKAVEFSKAQSASE